jgi:HK97 family phage major capsid protein
MSESTTKEAALQQVKDLVGAEVKSGLKSVEEGLAAVKAHAEELGLAMKAQSQESMDMIKGLRDEEAKRQKKGQEFSWIKAIKGAKSGNWHEAGYEKEIHENMMAKANASGVPAEGGYIVPTELWMDEYVELLVSQTVLDRAGVRRVTLAGHGNMEIPSQASHIIAQWVGEAVSSSSTDVTFNPLIELKPKTLMGLTAYSKKVLNQTAGNIDRIIKQDLFTQMVLRLEKDVFYGSGIAPVPLGLVNQSGLAHVVTTGGAGTPITYQGLLDLIGYVEDNNVNVNNAKFVSSKAFGRKLKSLVSTQGIPLFNPQVSSDPLDYYLGYEALTSTLINSTNGTSANTGEVFFGDFSNILVGMWQGLVIEQTDIGGTAFNTNSVIIKATGEYDIANRRPNSFAMITDAIVK